MKIRFRWFGVYTLDMVVTIGCFPSLHSPSGGLDYIDLLMTSFVCRVNFQHWIVIFCQKRN